MPRFILFDIDSTLIDSGGAGRDALNLALHEFTGVADGFKEIKFAGKTDPLIVREAFALLGIAIHDGVLEDFLKLYLRHLRRTIPNAKSAVKPGVTPLLEKLSVDDRVVLGLLTGNIQQGARLKLEPHLLNPYFALGAFGDDSEDRNQLLPVAVLRLSTEMGVSVRYSDCVVIGDTPKDVAAAQIHGAAGVAVATGPYPVEALRETNADLVVPDLSDTDGILGWIVRDQ
jgi:phosphoglycolate phosphatase